MNSPFKFLQAYGPRDQAIFFGRDAELDRMMELLAKGRLLLVYGSSGTGKTSLVQCGLATRFHPADWLPVMIRRRENFPASLRETLDGLQEGKPRESLTEAVQQVYKTHLRPLYLIFDQFEELFIIGEKEEQARLFEDITAILQSDLRCSILLVMREEYLAHLYPFERQIPHLLDRRLRVEPMSPAGVKEVILKSFNYFNITLEHPEDNVQRIIDNISDEKKRIQLPYLQVYLDRLYREDFQRTYPEQPPEGEYPPLTITTEELRELGTLEEVLGRFLREQEQEILAGLLPDFPALPLDALRRLLDLFVTPEGTKRPLVKWWGAETPAVGEGWAEEVKGILAPLGESWEAAWKHLVHQLETRRILKDNGDFLELAHDSLAEVIHRERSEEQRLLNELKRRLSHSYEEYQRSKTLLNEKQLLSIEDYLPRLILTEELRTFIRRSREEVARQKAVEEARQQRLWREMRKAKSNALAAYAILALLNEQLPLKSLRLSQYSLDYNAGNLTARGALLNAYYYQVFPLRGSFYTAPFPVSLHHGGFVYFGAVSPDGRWMVTVSNDRLVKLWDHEGRLKAALDGHERSIWHVAFAPDSRHFVTSSYDRTAIIWNIEGEMVTILRGHDDSVWAAAYAPGGDMLATVSGDRRLRLWEAGGKLLHECPGHEKDVQWVTFAPDGKQLATASKDGTVGLWTPVGKLIRRFAAHKGGVERVAFSPDGKKLLSHAKTGEPAVLWTIEGEQLATFGEEKQRIQSARFAPDGSRIAVTTDDGKGLLFHPDGELDQFLPGHRGQVFDCAFSPDGKLIATTGGDRTVRVWDRRGQLRTVLRGHRDDVWRVHFAPGGSRLLTVSKDNTGKLWSLDRTPLPVLKPHKRWVTGFQLLPGEEALVSVSNDRTLRRTPLSGEDSTILLSGQSAINSVAVAPNGKSLLIADRSGLVLLLDLKGKERRRWEHKAEVNNVVFSPSGKEIITVSKDGKVRLLALRAKKEQVLSGHRSAVVCAVFSPDGKYFATGSTDKRVLLWKRKTLHYEELSEHIATVEAVAFSPDGQLILTGSRDGSAHLLTVDGREMQTLQGHRSAIKALAFSPDGRIIATGAASGKLKLWDDKGVVLATIHAHEGEILHLSFTPDGHQIITGGKDKSIRTWELRPEELLKKLDAFPVDDLTNEEKERYGVEEGELDA